LEDFTIGVQGTLTIGADSTIQYDSPMRENGRNLFSSRKLCDVV
jgi:hypothetical protein